MNRILALITIFSSVCLAADMQPGRKAETTACVACHSTRLIDSQRLSAAAWAKEVDKMVGWGAGVSDKQLLIDYLASEFSDSKPVPPPATSGNGSRAN